MFKGVTRVLLVWIVLIGTVVVNGLANVIPFNNITTGEVSDLYPTAFTPANYVFGIWGVIYVGLFLFALYQSQDKYNDDARMNQLGTWFITGNLANTGWLVLWHYQIILPTIALMGALLVTLILSHLTAYSMKGDYKLYWMVKVPISVYLGWISVATIANAAVVLTQLGFTGAPLEPILWTIIMMAVATGLAIAMLVRHQDWAYGSVIVWAIIGIVMKHLG